MCVCVCVCVLPLQELDVLHEGVHVHDGGGQRRGAVLQQSDPPPGEGRDHAQQDDHLSRHQGLHGALQAAHHDLVQGETGDGGWGMSVVGDRVCVCVT